MSSLHSVSVRAVGQRPTVQKFLNAHATAVRGENAAYRASSVIGLRYPNDTSRHNIVTSYNGKSYGAGEGMFMANFPDEDTALNFAVAVRADAVRRQTLTVDVNILG